MCCRLYMSSIIFSRLYILSAPAVKLLRLLILFNNKKICICIIKNFVIYSLFNVSHFLYIIDTLLKECLMLLVVREINYKKYIYIYTVVPRFFEHAVFRIPQFFKLFYHTLFCKNRLRKLISLF